jgi:hypothetical protein
MTAANSRCAWPASAACRQSERPNAGNSPLMFASRACRAIDSKAFRQVMTVACGASS